MSPYAERFAGLISAANEQALRADPTLAGRLVLERHNNLIVRYAPFEHIQQSARVVIAGITPGAQQAGDALCEFRRRLIAGDDQRTALAAAKVFASFSGPMRTNLVAMLDYVGLAKMLGLATTASLWTTDQRLVHFTSVLRYPTFINGKNYNGQPSMTASPPLRRLLDDCLREEAAALPNAIWIPLGKAAAGVQHLVTTGALDPARVLLGLPHPSGANGERIAYFLGRKRREALSSKTDPDALDAARASITELVGSLPALPGAAA